MKQKYDYGRRLIIESPNNPENKLLVLYDEEKGTMLNYSTREPLKGTINILKYIDKKNDWWPRLTNQVWHK